ncbi:MAG: HIT domain-containing protein [Ignavibacteriae bacterium]|nr:HIT domain-containing protein [Ignavibacteriota bacterium]
MKRMWSPWRSGYIETFTNRPTKKKGKESLFSAALRSNDDDRHFIVWRGKHSFVIMNLYPYNSGHLMIVPYRQVSRFEDLRTEECDEIMKTAQRAIKALKKIVRPDGFNFGANIGRASGAGIDQHIHFHIVPRWNGDTNFMPVLTDTKVISEDMKKTLKKLRKVF